MKKNIIEERLLLTEREADLFYNSIEAVLDDYVKPDFNTFDLFVYMDYLYDSKMRSKVVGFIGETEDEKHQINLHRIQSGYLASYFCEGKLLIDIILNSKGQIVSIIK